MVDFKPDEYVQICPIPNTKWKHWDDNIHTAFCGRIGKITHIVQDLEIPNDRNEDLVFVEAHFLSGVFTGGEGLYFTFFKKRHLIKSSYWEFKKNNSVQQVESDIQEFDQVYKKKRDEIFKYLFMSDDEKEKLALDEIKRQIEEENEKYEDTEWEEPTEDYSNPFI